jgi:hypothetical protein
MMAMNRCTWSVAGWPWLAATLAATHEAWLETTHKGLTNVSVIMAETTLFQFATAPAAT